MSMRQHEDDYTYNVDSYRNSRPNRQQSYERDTDDNLYGSRRSTSRARSGDEAVSGVEKDDIAAGPLGWFNASPILDAIVGWVEGPRAAKKSDKPNPILDIPFQFIALLTYPEPDPKASNKMSLASKSPQRARTVEIEY